MTDFKDVGELLTVILASFFKTADTVSYIATEVCSLGAADAKGRPSEGPDGSPWGWEISKRS